MLAPDNRNLFLNALKPPLGYQFDRAIGTSFTLDLLTLLITPLSLALFDQAGTDEVLKDPLLLLEGLRRYAHRLVIFCQAGRIGIPSADNKLFRWLEEMVIEVQAPRDGGVFHPKLWLLRYVADDSLPFYRLLNLSRNLTFDKSWDLMVQLEGRVADRQLGYSRNRPLADFIAALPELATHKPLNDQIANHILLLSDEARKVDFQPPAGFEGPPAFHPIGIPGYLSYRFNPRISRYLVLSPFLTGSFLNRITKEGDEHILISRVEEIDELRPSIRKRFSDIFILNELATSEPEDEIGLVDGAEDPKATIADVVELSGLHAKLLVGEAGRATTWLIGSANATQAAFKSNVEFMIALKGKTSQIGIETILGDGESEGALRTLLLPYREPKHESELHEEQEQAEKLAEDVRKWLLDSKLRLMVEREDESSFNLVMKPGVVQPAPVGDYEIKCWPITLSTGWASSFASDNRSHLMRYEKISLISLTPFMAFEVNASYGATRLAIRFVLKLPIQGLPAERDDILFSYIISDRIQFMRYLRLLLAEEGFASDPEGLLLTGAEKPSMTSSWDELDFPLLEELVRALSRNPEGKIDRISEIVDRLRRTPIGTQILEGDFDTLWVEVEKARRQIL